MAQPLAKVSNKSRTKWSDMITQLIYSTTWDIRIHDKRPKALYKNQKRRHRQSRKHRRSSCIFFCMGVVGDGWLRSSPSSISRTTTATEAGRMRKQDLGPQTLMDTSVGPVHVTPSGFDALPQNQGKHGEAHLCLPTGKVQGAATYQMTLHGRADPPSTLKDAGTVSKVTALQRPHRGFDPLVVLRDALALAANPLAATNEGPWFSLSKPNPSSGRPRFTTHHRKTS